MIRFGRWLSYTAIVLLLLVVVFFVLLPAVFSSRLAVVYSGSMAPAMPMGAIAVITPVDPAEIKVGDIIAFDPPWDESQVTISHRVVEVVKEPALGFHTKGDANEDADPDIVPATSVVAKVSFNIPNAGYVLQRTERYTKTRVGFGLFIALPSILLIGSAARDMNFMLNPRKKRERKQKKRLERRRRIMSR